MQIGSRTLTPAEVEEYNHYIDSVLTLFKADCCAEQPARIVTGGDD